MTSKSCFLVARLEAPRSRCPRPGRL